MKYFAVIDTNVIVSAMLKNDSMPAQVLKEVLVGMKSSTNILRF